MGHGSTNGNSSRPLGTPGNHGEVWPMYERRRIGSFSGKHLLTPGDQRSCTTWHAPTDTESRAICLDQYKRSQALHRGAYSPLLSRCHGMGFLPVQMIVPGSRSNGRNGRCRGRGSQIKRGTGILRGTGRRGRGSLRNPSAIETTAIT